MITNFQLQSQFKPFYKAGKPITFTSDGFIIASDGEHVNYINTENFVFLKSFNRPKEVVTCFVANPNDNTVILANQDLQIRRIDRSHQDKRGKMWNSLHSAPVLVMSLNSTSTRLATGSSDNKVRIWHIGDNEGNSYSCCYHKSKITVLRNHPTEPIVVSVSMVDNDIAAWNTENGSLLGVFTGHQNTVTAIDFHSESGSMFTASRDQTVMVWDVATFTRRSMIPVMESIETCIVLALGAVDDGDSGVRLMVGGERGIMSIVSVAKRRIIEEIRKKSLFSGNVASENNLHTIRSMVATTGGIAVLRENDTIEWYNVAKSGVVAMRRELAGQVSELKEVVMVSDRWLLAVEGAPYMRLFDCKAAMATGGTQWPCQVVAGGHSDEVMSVAVFGEGRRLVVSGGKDGRVCVWRLDETDEREMLKLVASMKIDEGIVACVAADVRGERIYCSLKSSQESITVLNFSKDSLTKLCDLYKPHEVTVTTMDVNSETAMLVTGSKDKLAKVWKYNSKKNQLVNVGVCRGHRRGIWSVKFSDLEKVLLTTSMDRTIKLWSLESFDCIMSLQSESVVYRAVFSKNEEQIITCDEEGQVSVWSCEKKSVSYSVKVHEGYVQALNLVHDKEGSVTGFVAAGENSMICFYKDVSVDQIAENAKLKGLNLEQQQELDNLLVQKQYMGAFRLAVRLNKPIKAFEILEKIQQHQSEPVYPSSPLEMSQSSELAAAFKTLNEDELNTLLQFANKWISNAKTFIIAKDVFVYLLCTVRNADLCHNPDFTKHIERNKVHAYKHYTKTKACAEKVGLFDYLTEITVVKAIEEMSMDTD